MGRAHTGETRNSYRVLVENVKEKRPLGRPRNRGEDKIKINLKYDGKEQTGLIWLRTETNGGRLQTQQ
jgi:hypothetical protein